MAVSPTNGYCDGTQLKAALGIPSSDTGDDAALERAIESASRLIDRYCSRFFYDSGSATAKKFRADDPWVLPVPDFSTTTGLVVKTDTTGDGSYDTTWSSTGSPADYQVEPFDADDDGWPYTSIVATDDKTFPTGGRLPAVQVTAQWGWTAVPEPVVEACIIQASRIFKRVREAPFGVAALTIDGAGIRITSRLDPDVQLMIDGYRRLRIGAV